MKTIYYFTLGISMLLLNITTLGQTNHIQVTATTTGVSGDIYHMGGNVGIGTKSPLSGLHIKHDEGLYIEASSCSGFQARLRMVNGITNVCNAAKDDLLIESDGAVLIKLDRNANGISQLDGFGIFDKVNSCIFKVDQDGSAFLQGKFEAKEINVTTTPTADFVFAEDYTLRNLNEVEQFVKTNQHLPEIPSAKEMQENGVNMGEFQIKLLQKIEELTLYVIELKKENEAIKEQNKAIQQEIENIKN